MNYKNESRFGFILTVGKLNSGDETARLEVFRGDVMVIMLMEKDLID